MIFIRFTSDKEKNIEMPLSNNDIAEIAVVTKDTAITTGNVYAVTPYDMLRVMDFANNNHIQLEQVSSTLLSEHDGFPSFRNCDLPLTKEDLTPSDTKAHYNVLIVDGLGISINDILYRSSAWRSAALEMNQSNDVAFSIDFSASTPFAPLKTLLLANGTSRKVLIGPILFDSLLRYDYVIDEPKLASLAYSHKLPFDLQVSSVIDDDWKTQKIEPVTLPELTEFPELVKERVHDMFMGDPFILLNGVGDFPFNQIPISAQVNIATSLRNAGFKVAALADLGIEDEGIVNISSMASSLGALDIITKEANLVITTNSPSVALANKNKTPLLLLSVGAKDGIYQTESCITESIIIAEYDFFSNLNKVDESELNMLAKLWEKFDINEHLGRINSLSKNTHK